MSADESEKRNPPITAEELAEVTVSGSSIERISRDERIENEDYDENAPQILKTIQDFTHKAVSNVAQGIKNIYNRI